MNRLIIGAIVVLVFILSLTFFLTSFTSRKSQESLPAPTPVPTIGVAARSNPQIFNNTWETNFRPVNTDELSADQQNALDTLKTKLPFENDKFAIDYSPFLNQFFINKKTPDADQAINAFLEENGVSDLKDISNLFIESADSPRIAILKAEEQVTSRLEEEGGLEDVPIAQGSAEKTKVDYAIESGLTLFSFNFGAPRQEQSAPQGKRGSANCTNASGNVKIACEALNLLGFPYANGTEGVPIRYAGHPPGPWVDARNASDTRYKYLDCSGLTSVAVYKAFGRQNPGLHGRNYCSATYLNDKANFRRLGSLREIKPGDLVIKGTSCGNKGHVAVVISYDGNNSMEVAEAYSHKAPSARRTHRLNSGSFNSAVRYIGPGSTR